MTLLPMKNTKHLIAASMVLLFAGCVHKQPHGTDDTLAELDAATEEVASPYSQNRDIIDVESLQPIDARISRKSFDHCEFAHIDDPRCKGKAPVMLQRSITSSKQYKRVPDSDPEPVELYDDPRSLVDHANASSLRHPSSKHFFNSMMVYNYVDNALYTIYTSPGRITTLNLEKGESVQGVAAGDTASWMIEEITVPQGNKVFIKPYKVGLKTNIVLTTNLRSYFLEVESFEDTYMSSVSWSHPRATVIAHNQDAESLEIQKLGSDSAFAPKQPSREKTRTIETQVDLSALNFGYKIKTKRGRPSWKPVRAFDDGDKTFIEFADNFSTTDAPVLFLKGDKKEKYHLVNYRVKYPYYIVDRLFKTAVLRLDNDIVEIRK